MAGLTSAPLGPPALPGEEQRLWTLLLAADELGLRLEIVEGLITWEAHPAARHQRHLFRIQVSVKPDTAAAKACGCFQLGDVYIRFPDGSFKRPHISIFCREPEELDEAIEQIPDAVVEVLSAGYEKKDLEIGVPFYLKHGVKDVMVLDPFENRVTHYRRTSTTTDASPKTIALECGCVCTV